MRIGLRLMLFNCLLVFLPLAALLILDVFEGGLLASQENTMASQARVLASALGAFLDAGAPAGGLKASSTAALARLDGRTTTRLRVLDPRGNPVADSSTSGPPAPEPSPRPGRTGPPPPTAEDPFSTLTYQVGSLPFRLWRALSPPAAPEEAPDDVGLVQNPAVAAALAGGYGSHTRVSSGQRSVTLYAAVPIEAEGGTAGVVLASQSTWRTLQALYQLRLSLFQIFLASLVVALGLSFLMSLTISRPLKGLKAMAEGFIDQWGRPSGQFRPLKGRDELADLSRSLVRLGDGLADHVRFIESFASDLSHELRNPLAAIRAAGELLGSGQTGETARLSSIILSESDRIDRLAALSRDLGRLDVAVARAPRVPLDPAVLLADTAAAWALQGRPLTVEPPSPGGARFLGDRDFVRQALDKVVENALDYSPASVTLGWSTTGTELALTVADRGPGIPDDRKAQVFQRFATDRRDRGHTGLGLALVKAVAEGFGGTAAAEDRSGGGTVLVLRFPRSDRVTQV